MIKNKINPMECPVVTSITCTMERVPFPIDEDPCYLAKKAEIALRLPRIILTNKQLVRHLNQLVMSALIRIEEFEHDYLWSYKAEVVFAMVKPVPLPILATSKYSKEKFPNDLPHSSNIFARPPTINGINHNIYTMRRPDIILVKNSEQRWPGRSAYYFDGEKRDDNLKMLIEVKFPGDKLSKGQEKDYTRIATKDRFGVMRVDDNRTDKQKKYDRKYNEEFSPTAKLSLLPKKRKIGDEVSGEPIPEPVLPPPPEEGVPGTIDQPLAENLPLLSEEPWDYMPIIQDWVIKPSKQMYQSGKENFIESLAWAEENLEEFADASIAGYESVEDWAVDKKNYVFSLAEDGWIFLRDTTAAKFHQFGDWVKESGKWFYKEVFDPISQETTYLLSWISDTTGEMVEWSFDQLKEYWITLQKNMDITLEYLLQIDWVQILTDLGNDIMQVLIAIGKAVAILILTIIVVVALVLLVRALAIAAGAGAGVLAALITMLTANTILTQ